MCKSFINAQVISGYGQMGTWCDWKQTLKDIQWWRWHYLSFQNIKLLLQSFINSVVYDKFHTSQVWHSIAQPRSQLSLKSCLQISWTPVDSWQWHSDYCLFWKLPSQIIIVVHVVLVYRLICHLWSLTENILQM